VHSYRGTNAAWAAWAGNHDNLMWSTPGGHQDRLLARMALNNATSYCAGEVGVEQVCNYKGLQVALTGVGSRRTPEEGTAFLDTTFATYPNIWRVAMWHKNQLLYQTGPWTCVPAWFFLLCAYAHVYLFACKGVGATDCGVAREQAEWRRVGRLRGESEARRHRHDG
jgi:hypothetical protein